MAGRAGGGGVEKLLEKSLRHISFPQSFEERRKSFSLQVIKESFHIKKNVYIMK